MAVPNAEATDQAGMKGYREVIPGSDVTFQMLPIPGGKYTRGATEAEFKRFNKEEKEAKYDEGPQHEIEDRALLDGQVRGDLGRV